ncbi:MAG: two-component regulator propeller domain-containing protein [Ginsengibacter sp.]
MKKYFSLTLAFTFLILLIFVTSCNGQVENNVANEEVNKSNIFSVNQPKLRKTQGSQDGDNVHCSLQDKAGNLWFGTTGEGLYKYDGKSFTQFTTTNGLSSNRVWCILEDKSGTIWIGTDAGVCVYDGKTFTKIQLAFPKITRSNKYDVWSVMQDKSGKLWFATTQGVYCYDGKYYSSFLVDAGATGFKSNMVEYILEDKAGNFWFGGRLNKGVFRYDGKLLTNLTPNGDNWAWPVLQDKNGNIWFSNWGGAYRYDGKSFTSFTKNDGLCNDNVTRIIEDKNGNLWFGSDSKDGGLCRYDGKLFTHFTTKDGLINNSVWAILEDRSGNIWVGTRNTGLSLYNGKTFINFSE